MCSLTIKPQMSESKLLKTVNPFDTITTEQCNFGKNKSSNELIWFNITNMNEYMNFWLQKKKKKAE